MTIADYTAAILHAADTYRRENHCRCGAFVIFAPKQAGRQRACEEYKGVAA